jgi:hypothetical protein
MDIEFFPLIEQYRLPCTPERWAELEKQLGAALPASFVEFIEKNGGAAPDVAVVSPVAEACSWRRFHVDVVFGFYVRGEGYDLRDELAKYAGRAPIGMLPFATDPGDNVALVATLGDDAGAVYFRDHEHRELAERAKRTVREVYAELDAAGVATKRLDIDGAIMRWEELVRPYPGKEPGYGNLYLIADSFEKFLDGLRVVE